MIVIVDYHMGNLGSILNMLKKLDIEAKISSEKEDIKNANKLILPGVGAFDNGMLNIKELGLLDLLNYKVLDEKIPVLGICLGIQLMTISSEEGELPGLGWINAKTLKFKNNNIKIPHMGWNDVEIRKEEKIFQNIDDEPRFYFVHSFYVESYEEEIVIGKTNYGIEFTSAIHKDNIYATQFHPEKSHKFGMKVFENFGKI